MKIFASLIIATLITIGLGCALNQTVITNHQLERANE